MAAPHAADLNKKVNILYDGSAPDITKRAYMFVVFGLTKSLLTIPGAAMDALGNPLGVIFGICMVLVNFLMI